MSEFVGLVVVSIVFDLVVGSIFESIRVVGPF